MVQGPDGDEITFSGQRGVFNNISLDGGDYNNGFFGEQVGGQRAAIDITLDAVKEFQVVATGANAEFGRTAGGVVNVITKSGTNQVPGSLFHFQRLEGLTSNTSDGKPLTDFHREQFGATVGGPLVKTRCSIFGAFEGIREHLSAAEPVGDDRHAVPGRESDAGCQRGADQRQRRLPAAGAPRFLQDEPRPGRGTAGRAHDQQQRAPRQDRLGAECRQQPVGLVQLQLLEEREPDVRRGDLRHVGQRDRRARRRSTCSTLNLFTTLTPTS